MKYIVILGDGMSGLPLEELDGKTTLEAAHTPVMDELAGKGEMGMVQNTPPGMIPGSDIANLSVMGYDPKNCYTGRSSIEALSIGALMREDDVALRCNLVTLTRDEPYAEKTIADYSAGGISTEEAGILMQAVQQALDSEEFRFYTGTGYRHICIWRHGRLLPLQPPHDHVGQRIGDLLPKDAALLQLMRRSYEILDGHPLNLRRELEGKPRANALWFWGAGTKPHFESFYAKTGKHGAMVSAVDLLKGLGIGTGMKVIPVPGADGTLETNYEGKAQAAVDALLKDGMDLVYVHLEAPDEMSHQGKMREKIQAIENLDRRIVAPIKKAMEASAEAFRMLILPDHPNPICCRRHTADPVPYILYDSTMERRGLARYSEKEASETGNFEPEGYRMMARLLER